ncbi:MAG: hypothetical protein LBC96_09825 [Lachnospiraceae bacterium]|nr:hypothetical protein [Lachnospiraceae bacterium]
MEHEEKRKWLNKRKVIIGAVLLVIVLIAAFVFLDFYFERVYVKRDTHADFLIISQKGSPECVIISDKNEISNLLKSYRWHNYHVPCCWVGYEDDYTINVLEDGFIKRNIFFRDDWINQCSGINTPYNRAFLNKLHKQIINFRENENPSYQYTFHVSGSVDFYALKEQIYSEGNGNIAYRPTGSSGTPISDEVKEYQIDVVFAREQSMEELEYFCQQHGIDSFDLVLDNDYCSPN